MAPPSKCTKEQQAYLMGLLDKFLEAQKHSRLDKFWLVLFRGWFEQWEEEEDNVIVDEGERKQDLGVKITKRQELIQLYIKKYYKTRIHSKLYKGLPAGTKLSSADFLALLHNKTPKLFELEKLEIKKEIEDLYQALKERDEDNNEDMPLEQMTAARYAVVIDEIPRYFQAFCQELARRTGWSFTLLAGGPDPINGGRVNSIGVHFGENEAGQHFGKATPGFGDTVLTLYANFLNMLYTQAECNTRSLIPIDSVALPPADTPFHDASAATLPSLNAVVVNPTTNPAVLATPAAPAVFTTPGTPTTPAAFATPGLPAVSNTDPALITLDGFVDKFDWSNFDLNIATVNTTIPFKAPWAPLAEDGLFSSFLDELAADLPNDILSTSATATNVSTPTAVNLPAVPTTLILPAPEVPAAPDSPIPSLLVTSEESNAQTTGSTTEPPAAGPAPSVASAAEGTTTLDLGPLSNIDDPTVLPLHPCKRGRDVTEDPAFIVTGKRVRKPSKRKEWKTMTVSKGKENRHPKKDLFGDKKTVRQVSSKEVHIQIFSHSMVLGDRAPVLIKGKADLITDVHPF
ncbi:hypothetical protein BDN71DRAFT_1428231 [Pleurotus eryngii]|uniref:Uncharacterized protein n=1 Tax=Pleurotus eryngii TaxID=5323 RepID=A0A9P6A531_PLEER|nr:hypothetical protein BDN71DRAFT_1428231 [Pleurotus eryngii]